MQELLKLVLVCLEVAISYLVRLLPSPPFALLIRNGNVETFVIGVNQRSAEGNQNSGQ